MMSSLEALFDKKCKLIRLSPIGFVIDVIDVVTALRARLWQ